MQIDEAIALLRTIRADEVHVGQRSMTIPVEVAETVLALWEQARVEYGSQQAYQSSVSVAGPFEDDRQRTTWARCGIVCGLSLHTRGVIVLEDWQPYTLDEVEV